MIRTALAQPSGSAVRKITGEKPKASLMSLTCVQANRNDSSRIQPPMPEKKIERQRPCAAAFEAPPVSSETCAEASNPVIVYCVSKKPSGSTRNQYQPSPKPELLMRSVNTKLAVW